MDYPQGSCPFQISTKDRISSAKGLTYDQTAEQAGISRTYIAKILQGDRNPDDAVVLKLADVLQMDRKEILFIAHRDRAPKEAKDYFGGKPLKSVRSLPSMFLDLTQLRQFQK